MGTIAHNPIPATGRPYLLRFEDYHPSGTGSGGATADQAAMAAAIADANAAPYGAVVDIPPGDYYLAGPFTHDPDVHIKGAGYGQTTLNHTGNNTLFTCLTNRGGFRHSYRHVRILGNSGAAAQAIETGNAYGIRFAELEVKGYTANNGIKINNTTAGLTFTEGLLFHHVRTYNNLRNVRFEINGGTGSLSDMRMEDCHFGQDVVNSVGLSFRDAFTWYAGTLNSKFQNEVASATAIDLGAGATIVETGVNALCEGWTSSDATAGIGIRGTSTSQVRCWGRFQLFSGANTLNHSMPSGSVFRLQGSTGGLTFKDDVSATLQPDVDAEVIVVSTLTANRTLTLGSDKIWGGAHFRIVRQEATPSAFTITIVDAQTSATLFTFAASTNQAREFMAGRNSFFYAG